MEKRKIAAEGVWCCVKAKAAFVELWMRHEKNRLRLEKEEERGKEKAEFFERELKGEEVMHMQILWNREQRERIYNEVFQKRLAKVTAVSDAELKLYMKPLLEMEGKEIVVQSLPFLVYAIVRNEQCRRGLRMAGREEGERWRRIARSSELVEGPFFSFFLQQEYQDVKLAVGLIKLVEQEEKEQSGDRYYQLLMEILCRGYHFIRQQIRNTKKLNGAWLKSCIHTCEDLLLGISTMMTALVIAQDMNREVEEDYNYYLLLHLMGTYEKDFLEWPEDEGTKEGERRYQELCREHVKPESCYASYYMEPAEEEIDMEELLRYFQVNLRMFEQLELQQKEAEYLCSLGQQMSWEEYRYFLLVGTLCKYIVQLQKTCERLEPEEIREEREKAEREEKKLQETVLRQKQKLEHLEKQKKENQQALRAAQAEKNKLEKQMVCMEEGISREKEELIGLRNFVFKFGQNWRETSEIGMVEKEEEILTQKKILVVGGGEHWQRKLRRVFPDSQFLTTDRGNFNPGVLERKEYIVINTDQLRHSLYYKIMNRKRRGQKVLYVHGNNVETTLQQMRGQIRGNENRTEKE